MSWAGATFPSPFPITASRSRVSGATRRYQPCRARTRRDAHRVGCSRSGRAISREESYMRSAPKFIVGLGACALLAGTALPAAGQSEPRKPPVYGELPEARTKLDGGPGKVMRGGVARGEASGAATVSNDAPSASRPSDRSSSPASATAAAAVGQSPAHANAAPPAAIPSRLSSDAPEGGPPFGSPGSKPGRAPSATPEPSTLLLMGAGLAGLYGLRRRR